MGKIRLFLASLLAMMVCSVPAFADTYQILYSPETGTYTETNPTGTYARTWVSTDAPHVTLKTSVNNINVADGGLYGQTYTLSVEGGYLIKSFVFTARPSDNSDGMSVTLENGTEYPVDPAGSRVRATDVNAESTTFVVVGRYLMVEGFTIIVEDNPDYVPPVYVTDLSQLSNEKAYMVTNVRRTWMFTDEAMGSSQNPNKDNAYQQVAFINHENNFYIYSVGAKKYLNPDNTLTNEEPTPVQIVATEDANYPWFFKFDDEHNININGAGQVLIDTWTYMDDGNKNKLMEAGDFDPTEALKVFNTMTELPDGDYYVRNVATGQYMGYGNSWGTQASLMDQADYVNLTRLEDGTYRLDSRVTNGGESHYLGKNYYMDNNDPLPLTITPAGKYYTISAPYGTDATPMFIGYDGSTTVLAFNLEDGTAPAAQWEILTREDLLAAMALASEENPVDATFLVKDPNFARNHRDYSAWTFEANNQNNSGANENFCVESYHSTFSMSQVVEGAPAGIYSLTAQGFYRQDGSDEENLPYFFMNDEKGNFPLKTGTENSMSDASASFSKGSYTIDPLFVKIENDGTLTIGAKNEANTTIWCIWDNFQLKYYGTEGEIEDVKFAALLKTIEELRNEAEALKSDQYANEAVAEVIDPALEATADVEKTEEALKAAIATLQGAIDEAKKLIADNTIVVTGVVPNNSMLHWVREPEFGDFHVNTWSTEGNSDGTGMVTPFIENWTYSGNGTLADGDIYYVVPGTLPAGTYEVTALVRANSEAGNDPAGISFFVNDATTDLVAEGTAFTYNAIHGVYANVALKGTVGEDGVLKFGVRLAGTNVNWIAIKDAKFMPYYETSNLDFEEGAPVAGDDAGICTYAKDVAANNTTLSGMQEVPSWTFGNENGDARAAGLFAYGSDKFLGGSGFNVPAAGPVAAEPEAGARRLVVKAGEANQALGVVSVWTAKTSYEQNVTLPAGNYVLTIPYYNAGGTGNIAKNLIGFIANDGTEYLSTAANFGKVGEWVNEVVTFTLTEQTNGKLSLGYTATNSGSGAMPHLFFDKVEITTVSDADLARADLEAAIVAAELQLESTEGVGEGLFAIPQSAADEYLEAITAALEVLENPDATVEEIRAAIETLKAAGETFAAAPKTQPEAGKYYTFRLAKDDTFFDPDNEYYMTFEVENDAVGVDLEPVELTFEPAEVEGQYYLASADGMYVGRKSNDWATSVLAENKVAWAFTRSADGSITIDRIDNAAKHLGAETDYPNKNTQCWADKNASSGRIFWFVEPVKEEVETILVNGAEVPVVKTITVNHEEYEKTDYSGLQESFDPAEVLSALGIESFADATQYIVNVTTNEAVENTTDGWRNADGDAASWFDAPAGGVCVKISDPATGLIDYIGCYDKTHVAGDTYTAKWAFVAGGKAAVIDVVITWIARPELYLADLNMKGIDMFEIVSENGEYAETKASEALDLEYVTNLVGADYVVYGVEDLNDNNYKLTNHYTCSPAPGFWCTADGVVTDWGAEGFKVGVSLIDNLFTAWSNGVIDEDITVPFFFVNPTTKDAYQAYVTVKAATVGINGINAADLENADIYTIGGVKIQKGAKLQKGIYIVNGKKMSVK